MFRNLRFENKIWFLVAVIMACVMAMQAYESFKERENLLDSRKSEIVHLVENAQSLVDMYYQQKDVLGEERAKESAIKAVQALRYDKGQGYFWINDESARLIMHPIKPELNGKDMSEFKDPLGTKMFSEFAKTAKLQGQGYVYYYWEKPGSEEPVGKVSFVKGFKPWGFVIGTGLYIDDIEMLFWEKVKKSVFLLCIVLVVAGVFARLMGSDMAKPLGEIIAVMKDAAAGDFSHTLHMTPRKDEMGELAESFVKMQAAFKELIQHSLSSAQQLSASSSIMNDVSEKTNKGVSQQYSETELLASAIEELATTIQEVANNAADTLSLTDETNRQIDNGNNMMTNTIKEIQHVSDDMGQAGVVIGQLEADVKQIDTILSVIRNISEQTNLLALNAAIEAARAGETGRGFAVVADEVRSLAQRTHESTEEIQAMTEALQAAASNAVRVMDEGKAHIQSCVENAHETGGYLAEAATKVVEVNDRNNMIASTVEQQGIVASEVSKNVLAIKEVAEETFHSVNTLSSSSDALHKLSQETEKVLSKYKV